MIFVIIGEIRRCIVFELIGRNLGKSQLKFPCIIRQLGIKISLLNYTLFININI